MRNIIMLHDDSNSTMDLEEQTRTYQKRKKSSRLSHYIKNLNSLLEKISMSENADMITRC